MLNPQLTNLAVVILVQFLFFITNAWILHTTKSDILRSLWCGMLVGLPFGVLFDLTFGKYIGVFTYEPGFTVWFLVINGILSYGLMVANVQLLQHTRFIAPTLGRYCLVLCMKPLTTFSRFGNGRLGRFGMNIR